jgi:hypothetical protein
MNFIKDKKASWKYNTIAVTDLVKFSSLFEKLLKIAFDWLKIGKIIESDFLKMRHCFKNDYVLKMLFKVLIQQIKQNDRWYQNFDFYFAAFSKVMNLIF